MLIILTQGFVTTENFVTIYIAIKFDNFTQTSYVEHKKNGLEAQETPVRFVKSSTTFENT